jgi:murein L,D-transpeptidase YcbB/YkuD
MGNSRSVLAACVLLIAQCAAGAFQEAIGQESASSTRQSIPSIADRLRPGEEKALAEIYANANATHYWTDDAGLPTHQAHRLLDTLKNASAYGLRAQDYSDLVDGAEQDELKLRSTGASAQARFDLLLSTAAIRFVTHLHFGRVEPRAAGFDLPAKPKLDVAVVVGRLATSPDLPATVLDYEPSMPMYRRLKDALVSYRTLANEANLTELPPLPKVKLEIGDRYEGVERLLRLLRALGDEPQSSISNSTDVYDAQIANAIANFQRRHGFQDDGVLGAKTFAALTTPIDVRVRQIELSLERWRWVPELGRPLVVINIPRFMLIALSRDGEDPSQRPLEIPVVVGRSGNRTPVFLSAIESVVFRPYWNVPRNILRNELLPKIRADESYLDRHEMEIVAGEGDDAKVMRRTPETLELLAKGRLRLRQRPSPQNALGSIKFVLPNPYEVYLHGSPEVQLFSRERRSFSHGCVRVADPAALAEYVLREASERWSLDEIEAAMCGAATFSVRLQHKVPILLIYNTAVASGSQGVLFFEDVYGLDRKLAALLGLGSVRRSTYLSRAATTSQASHRN